MLTEHRLPTPIGGIIAVAAPDGLCALQFADRPDLLRRHLARWYPGMAVRPGELPEIATALDAWFAGDLTALARLPLALHGSPFQLAVWTALREIPAGEVMTYGDLARTVGRPGAARAVGAANAANPVAIVVPCHRVVPAPTSPGSPVMTVGGYAGGAHRKEWLLAHERTHARTAAAAV
jgi:O-6-methylguanine DNA methyltransferase